MRLRDYLKPMSTDELAEFAGLVRASVGHLKNVGYGYKPCSPALASAIERYSGRAVMRWELCPDDWHEVWPELKRRKDAPAIKVEC